MRVILVLLLFAAFAAIGCSTGDQMALSPVPPDLLVMSPLPPVTNPASAAGIRLNVLFHVLPDGAVDDVRILGSSGDAEWDSLAERSMREWKFAKIPGDGHTAALWVRQGLIVQVQQQEPLLMFLGALSAPNRQQADSLYALLSRGISFDSLAHESHEPPPSRRGAFLGNVDITRYPPAIQKELRKLHENEVAPPLPLDKRYVIFKRFARDTATHD